MPSGYFRVEILVLYLTCFDTQELLVTAKQGWEFRLPDQVSAHVILRRRDILLLPGGDKSPHSPCGLHSHQWEREREDSLLPSGDESFCSPLSLLCTTLVGVLEVPCYNLAREENLAFSTWLLSLVGGGLLFCLWGLAGTGLLLFRSFLSCQAVPFLVLWPERAGFSLGIFFCLWLSLFLGCQLLQSGIYRQKETNPRIQCPVIPLVLRSLVSLPPSLYLFESPYVCFTCNVQGFSCT